MYRIESETQLNMPIEEAWNFFSRPENLSKISPKEIGFKILNKVPSEMYEGLIINYKVKPLLGITMPWSSEITKIEKHKYFIDSQLSGPYKIWHHQHFFEENEKGTLLKDIVHYEMPLGVLGKLAHFLFVKAKVQGIFDYREIAIKEIFGQ